MSNSSLQKVVVASLNPAKIQAVESAFKASFPATTFTFEGVSVASEVPDQPMNDQETKLGALNRVRNAKVKINDGDYYVGLEAGIEGDFTYAWMIIEDNHKQIKRGESRSACLMLPPSVLEKVRQGKELGYVMDEVFSTENIKQKGGAIGLLTHHQLTRSSVYHQALVLALIPFLNPEHF
ncbi:inosine/xanthosine triphosphatase [Vibrio rumoiensis]|uniref:Inosine/xanthosine triphosphatase n=1 Tax=Vibrio rumoiensis 1S-45 TaxID=1188252 RepID=A0A1E5DYD9_9VIBR|nr:inosine/xanthosine triphosphatase [Vibrio rumoiensis]OEF22565.1 inosine/xanthosine triphosphatase [Vibrio rumoiensis 1S-45]